MQGKAAWCICLWVFVPAILLLGTFPERAAAKEPTLFAIELFDGPNGPAFVQLSDVSIDGKIEMRQCLSTDPLDHSAYSHLLKVTLVPGGILERGEDGVVRYTSAPQASAICVVPTNVKFERKGPYTISELEDLADLRGLPIIAPGEPPGTKQPFNRGTTLVLLAAPDLELAEFLLARRASTIPVWLRYLGKYPTTTHTPEARLALASLYIAAGQKSLAAYLKSEASSAPVFSQLKDAKVQLELARAQAPGMDSVTKLAADIRLRLIGLTDNGRRELDSYRNALTAHSAGFPHLPAARKLAEAVADIDPDLVGGRSLLQDVVQDSNAFDQALRSARSAETARQMDDAYTAILPYRNFAEDEPRVAAILDAAYSYHFDRGKKYEDSQDWQNAIREFDRAGTIKDTSEARDSLKNAQAQLVVQQDKAAAESALRTSKSYEEQQDILRAYEALYNLPPAQQHYVIADLRRLGPEYVIKASQEAKDLRQAHDPIKGINDERQIEDAYVYLQRAYQLSADESLRDRRDNLGKDLSVYLLAQAKHYLDKPAGSGSEMGWKYLERALPYKAPNLPQVRDAETAAGPIHAMRSKLSIRVQFRDQTSARNQANFTEQLENSVITSLESSIVPVKAVRSAETVAIDPDFQLSGDVLRRSISQTSTEQLVESKYRGPDLEQPNEEWYKLNREYESAQIELQTQQAAISGARNRGKKPEIDELDKKVAAATKRVEEAHLKLDSVPKTKKIENIQPYRYTKKTIEINGIVQLQFRITELLGDQTSDPVNVLKETHNTYVVPENVNPDDSEGIKRTSTNPPTVEELMTSLENSALDELNEKVRKRVEDLPHKVYSVAKTKEDQGDTDGAGEGFLRFLKMTHEDDSSEQQHAKNFLLETFNMRVSSQATP